MYHGRILDYLRGMGLEQNAAVIVTQPDQGNAWVNVSYAGFIGSVTAMNEKQVAIGEMGGRGEGHWDGKPMAQLVREVMEKANTLEEAIEIMRRGPRTCEYYYVISDAKSKRAAGIAATPETFEVIWPGQSHPRLPHPIDDAVLMSAGDRYEELARRVKAGYGHFDTERARDLMKREGSIFVYDWIGQKCFEDAAPMGPWLTPAAYISDPNNLTIKLWVNGVLKQDSNTSKMVHNTAEQIAYLSRHITLQPGDVIATGTPAGVGLPKGEFLKPGDEVKIEIAELGTLTNRMVADAA